MQQTKKIMRVITSSNTNPVRTVTFSTKLQIHIPPNRMRQRPKFKWAQEGLKELWEQIKIDKPEHRTKTLDTQKEEHINIITEYSEENKDKQIIKHIF